MNLFTDGFNEAIQLLVSGNDSVYSAIAVTITVSSWSLLISLIIGLPLGFLLGYYNFPGKTVVRTIVDTLLALPTVVIGLIAYTMLSRSGVFGEFGLLFTQKAIIIGQIVLGLPIIIALTATQVEAVDKRLYLSLKGLGANSRQILLSTLLEARFGLMTAAMTAYGRIVTEIGISMMVGGNIKYHTRTVTTAIALETGKGEFITGIALGLVLFCVALMVNIVLSMLKRKWTQ
ncbi:ABC transporter permease [Malaciobacter canalis]|jgi:tungstate transport system permease protein|uniref:Tungstate transport system permease protein n=2 Tax=Malaciobacter TaxID=2321114 RepID=A0AB36ZT53_9BACT|nr:MULTISPECIES: ABC transporter permease [Malaciobacter]PHO09863.1 ABC transporter permease [Malaciobacter canalis]PPK58809.1 tungstate transport system permease protein [Malaciobacter marinus]QEE33482.1 tungsten ABC transporter TupABC, permease protein [Malaciobacter canalis]SKB39457.1 tungstate transport system permease protein [Malaciobacter marinus]